MSIKNNIILLFILLPITVLGFDFTAVPVAATCTGNGQINMTVANTNPSGTITYFLYKLPNTTTPLASTTTLSFVSLSAGDYIVEAREVVGTTTTTQQTSIVILDQFVELSVNGSNIVSTIIPCSTNSIMTITPSAGIGPFMYEIISGPSSFTAPLQSSNFFTNLVAGSYSIRVWDACGNAKVVDYTVTANSYTLSVDGPTIAQLSPPTCNSLSVTNTITASTGTAIAYPLAIQYAVHDPAGGTTIFNQNIATGNPDSVSISQVIPSYINTSYTYDFVITDNCGNIFNNTFTVTDDLDFSQNTNTDFDCIRFFTLTVDNFIPPYNLNFTTYPAGFNPATFTTGYPGPYTQATTDFGSQTNAVPYGNYEVTATDACGKIKTITFEIKEPEPHHSESLYNCLSTTGFFTLTMDPDSTLVGAIIINGPPGVFTYPYDISSQIVNGIVRIDNLPIGSYIVQPYDNCPTVLDPVTIVISQFVDGGFTSAVRPGCDLGLSSFSVSSNNGKLTNVIITGAPSAFSSINSLPFDASNFISQTDGKLYLDNIPPGNYTLTYIDACLQTNTLSVSVVDYQILSNTTNIVRGCGIFNIALNYNTNGVSNDFWLQKLIDPTTDTWGHPDYPNSGSTYTAGTVPSNTSALSLANNTTNLNISYNGTFRIVHSFLSFNNGETINSGGNPDKICLEVIDTFTYNEKLEILDIYRMPCSTTGSLDVVVVATGFGTIQYSLLDTNRNLLINNGSNNVFSNLTPGNYLIRIEDSCNMLNQPVNVADLASLIVASTPSDMLVCNNTTTFDLTSQTATILGTQNPTLYTVTYFETLSDAQNNTNAIPNPTTYNPTIAIQDIYARIVYNTLTNCFETVTFKLYKGQTPVLNISSIYNACDDAQVVVDASIGNLPTTTYVWTNTDTGTVVSNSATATITAIGYTNLSVEATNTYGTTGSCSYSKNTTVLLSQAPKFDHIDIVDWTENDNSITIYTTNNLDFEYSIDGSTWQTSNTFTGLTPGIYTVHVRDIWNCGQISKTVALFYYQRFFTPNGDGANDVWSIKYSQMEPTMNVFIFDRYGKLVKNFQGYNGYWDGTYNGEMLFSDDYWFLVKRADGREHLGHFAMKR